MTGHILTGKVAVDHPSLVFLGIGGRISAPGFTGDPEDIGSNVGSNELSVPNNLKELK